MIHAGGVVVGLGAFVAGILMVSAVAEIIKGAPGLGRWLLDAIAPLRRAGQEGYLPSGDERRRLGIVSAVVLLVGALVTGGLGPLVLVAIAGPSSIWALVKYRRSRYLQSVEQDLPEISNAIADALTAGASLRGALSEASASLTGPSAREFARIRADLEGGLSTRGALKSFASRLGSLRADDLVALLLAGAGSGADLVSLLRRFGAANLERNLSVRDARSATAQARYTGAMVVALPLGAALFAEMVRPGFFAGIFANPASTLLLALSAALQVAGLMLVRYLARVAK